MAQEQKGNDKDDEKKLDGPSVLVMGGCGFIGRNLVQNLAARGNINIVVADKLLPQTSYMTQEMIALYKDSKCIKVVHSDLSKQHHIKKIFVDIGYDYDYIINLCGETRFGQSDQDYNLKCLETCKQCMIAAGNCKKLKMWIEVSTAQIYEPAKKPLAENSKIAPFTKLANYRFQCEQLIQKSGYAFLAFSHFVHIVCVSITFCLFTQFAVYDFAAINSVRTGGQNWLNSAISLRCML